MKALRRMLAGRSDQSAASTSDVDNVDAFTDEDTQSGDDIAQRDKALVDAASFLQSIPSRSR
jgi:hypothetical protein